MTHEEVARLMWLLGQTELMVGWWQIPNCWDCTFLSDNGPMMPVFIRTAVLMVLLTGCGLIDSSTESSPTAKRISTWDGTLDCRDCVDWRTDGTDQINLTINGDNVSGGLGLFGWNPAIHQRLWR